MQNSIIVKCISFEVPLKKWVEDDLKENIFDTLSTNCYSKQLINKNFVDKLLAKNIKTLDEKRTKMLWNMYSLEVWKNAQ